MLIASRTTLKHSLVRSSRSGVLLRPSLVLPGFITSSASPSPAVFHRPSQTAQPPQIRTYSDSFLLHPPIDSSTPLYDLERLQTVKKLFDWRNDPSRLHQRSLSILQRRVLVSTDGKVAWSGDVCLKDHGECYPRLLRTGVWGSATEHGLEGALNTYAVPL